LTRGGTSGAAGKVESQSRLRVLDPGGGAPVAAAAARGRTRVRPGRAEDGVRLEDVRHQEDAVADQLGSVLRVYRNEGDFLKYIEIQMYIPLPGMGDTTFKKIEKYLCLTLKKDRRISASSQNGGDQFKKKFIFAVTKQSSLILRVSKWSLEINFLIQFSFKCYKTFFGNILLPSLLFSS